MKIAPFLFLTFCSPVLAGEFNSVLSIGDAAPGWEKLPAADGKEHALADFADADAVIVAFTCNSCPYAVDVEDRLIALAAAAAEKKVAVVAINVNKVPADSLEKMAERAKEKSFNFPYLFDDTQQIARDYGASRTPEFFVLNKDRKIVYMGALDDSPDGKKVTKTYVNDALAAALAGKEPEVKETVPIGCGIRYKRERK